MIWEISPVIWLAKGAGDAWFLSMAGLGTNAAIESSNEPLFSLPMKCRLTSEVHPVRILEG